MKKRHHSRIKTLARAAVLAGTLSAVTALSLTAQEARTDFSDGTGNRQPNQYPGSKGSGWSDGWSIPSHARNITLSLQLEETPRPSHLAFDMQVGSPSQEYNNASVMRKYRDADRPHTIRFKIQVNKAEGFDVSSDFVGAFGGDRPRTNFTIDSTWAVRTIGKTPSDWRWAAYHGDANGGAFSGKKMEEIGGWGKGMSVKIGKTYEITIKNYPKKGTYDISVSDGRDSVSAEGLRYRAKEEDWAPAESAIAFQAQTKESGDSVHFSIYEVEISPLN